jgi:P pilus assembly chaperone PapD
MIAGGAAAQAADNQKLSVVPIRLNIAEVGHAQTVSVINGGDSPMDIAVGAYSWAQHDGAALDLSESKNLLVFPRTIHLNAYEQRDVRVGIVTPLTDTEGSYRLSFTQISDPTDLSSSGSVAMRLRITMPVFITPIDHTIKSNVEIQHTTVGQKAIAVQLHNRSNLHVSIQSISIEALDAHGTHIGSSQAPGWYILANAEQTFSVPLPTIAAYAQATTFKIQVSTDDGKAITKTIAAK